MSRLKEWINALNEQFAPWLNWKKGLQPAPVKSPNKQPLNK
jgi:hypothetical protein